MYRGYDIHEMAEKASFEEVAYLLLNGELPTIEQLSEFTNPSSPPSARCPKQVLEMLRLMPKNTHPMDMLRTGVSMLAPFDPELNDNSHDANIRKAIRLIAKVSTLITDGWRIQQGEDPLPERPDLTLAGNLFYKLTRRSAAGVEDPNDGHDFHSLRRPRIQRLDLRGARDGVDAGRHVCGGHERLRHVEGSAARRRE